MASATKVIGHLVKVGIIPYECKNAAVRELHRELLRRSRRVATTLASLTSATQLALHAARIS
jgi:hypothetical protein